MEGKFISYIRVSTTSQQQSGLGLEAQRQAILNHLNGGNWRLVKEYVEVESGRKNDRPELLKALEHCKRIKATLIISRLDRLSRSVSFLANLMESGVDFIALDAPYANKFMLHVLSAVAQHEAEVTSQRTKDALAAAKARGVKLGNPHGFSRVKRNTDPTKATEKRMQSAREYSERMYPIIKKHIDEGKSLRWIAKEMEHQKELSPRGTERWSAMTVKLIVDRVERRNINLNEREVKKDE